MLLLLQVVEILHLFTMLSSFFEICLLSIRRSHVLSLLFQFHNLLYNLRDEVVSVVNMTKQLLEIVVCRNNTRST